MSHSWHFRERACQFHSENYHSIADHVCLGQTYAYIWWPEGLDSQFLPLLPAFPQGKALPWTLCRWQMSRLLSSPPGITHERDTRAQPVTIESSLWAHAHLEPASTELCLGLLGCLPGESRAAQPAEQRATSPTPPSRPAQGPLVCRATAHISSAAYAGVSLTEKASESPFTCTALVVGL